MTRRRRVLVVDDGVLFRRTLCALISDEPDLIVIGTAPSGILALARIEEHKPDIVTLDVNMSHQEGLSTLVEIRRRWSDLPVILFSARGRNGTSNGLEPLPEGATAYVVKPSEETVGPDTKAAIQTQLIPRIRGLLGLVPALVPAVTAPAGAPGAGGRPALLTEPRPAPASLSVPVRVGAGAPRSALPRIDILAIGSSTGGPNALQTVISGIAGHCPVPVVITQHMPAYVTRLLAERLTQNTGMPVHEGKDGDRLVPGQAWLAPGGYHMTVAKGATLHLNQDPPENFCRPAVDVMFRSVTAVYGANVLSVVLTGMGSDGLKGATAIRESGGVILAQDEQSSVVWGMPGAVTNAGIADRVLPLDRMAQEIVRLIQAGREVRPITVTPTTG